MGHYLFLKNVCYRFKNTRYYSGYWIYTSPYNYLDNKALNSKH